VRRRGKGGRARLVGGAEGGAVSGQREAEDRARQVAARRCNSVRPSLLEAAKQAASRGAAAGLRVHALPQPFLWLPARLPP
jgi:hypothetical protein